MSSPFALWITGPPASGKSSITAALVKELRKRELDPAVLGSDLFRNYFQPQAPAAEEQRLRFYQGMIEIAALLVERGVPVLLDATGSRRAYRAAARERLHPFAEVFIDCPLEVCMARDKSGAYRKGPSDYEPPAHPDLHVKAGEVDPADAAKTIMDFLIVSGWIPARKAYRV